MEGRLAPVIGSAECTTFWSFLHSCALELPNQAMMHPVRIHSILYLSKFVWVFWDIRNLSKPPGKWRCWWAFFAIASLCWAQGMSSEMLTSKNLKRFPRFSLAPMPFVVAENLRAHHWAVNDFLIPFDLYRTSSLDAFRKFTILKDSLTSASATEIMELAGALGTHMGVALFSLPKCAWKVFNSSGRDMSLPLVLLSLTL